MSQPPTSDPAAIGAVGTAIASAYASGGTEARFRARAGILPSRGRTSSVRFLPLGAVAAGLVAAVIAGALTGSAAWWVVAAVLAGLVALGLHDLVQRRHSLLRNYPLLGHLRFLLE